MFFSIIFALPAFYYLFILEVNFLTGATPGINEGETIGLNFNFSNKILIISSIILFHLIPFIISRTFIVNFFKSFKKNLLIVIIIFVISIVFFDYLLRFTGGGFFFQISNFLFQSNYFFYFFSFLLLLLAFFSRDNFNNFLIFILLIISNVQNTIYHKYYDPLVMILFFTILNTNLSSFLKKHNVFYVYGFYSIFILMSYKK